MYSFARTKQSQCGLHVLQVLNKPSLKTFYLGAEREVDVPTEYFALPQVKDLPIPNATWKDCHLEISQPFEGELAFLFCAIISITVLVHCCTFDLFRFNRQIQNNCFQHSGPSTVFAFQHRLQRNVCSGYGISLQTPSRCRNNGWHYPSWIHPRIPDSKPWENSTLTVQPVSPWVCHVPSPLQRR